MGRIIACKTSELGSGQMKKVSVDSREILVVNVNGNYFACDDTCTHAGASLSEGSLQAMESAIQTLNQLATSHSTPKNFKKTISDLITELQTDEYSLSVRAANAISSLDDITQDPNVPSFVRTTLWQAVSVLESIRE